MKDIYADKILFNHSYYFLSRGRKTKDSSIIEGTFEGNKVMYVYDKGIKAEIKYEILFWDKTKHCAVIKVLPMSSFYGQKSHDLRVWNSSILQGPSQECLKKYKEVEKDGRLIYNATCQQILPKRFPPEHPQPLPKGHKSSG
ncbi:uncharacterized protein LOC125947184 [Dermacentor silvarum]|uniref:uncharacterized protein LOC125947184 n=1 Tax=Dermacentor silvarum TaxID=543639 RepID=UPI002101892C|nr:uncharacterized protein LOC125947184 [Dermacentor silvarum]